MDRITLCKILQIACSAIVLIVGIKCNDIVISAVAFIGIAITALQSRLEHQKERYSELKEKANCLAGHLRSVRANYFNSQLKSTSSFLQVLISELSTQEVIHLIKANFFNDAERKELIKYLKTECHITI